MFDEQQPTPLTPPKKVFEKLRTVLDLSQALLPNLAEILFFRCCYSERAIFIFIVAFRYQGGDHKLVSIRRDISYAELVHRFTEEYDKDISIKYMLPGETEQLVSVTTEEDLKNMLEEHDDLQAVFEYDFPVRVESADSFETIRQEEVFPQESIFCEQDVDVEYEKVLVEQEQAHIQELRSQIAQLHDDPFHKDGDAVDGTERELDKALGLSWFQDRYLFWSIHWSSSREFLMSFGLPESLSSNTASFEEGFGFFASEQSEGVSNWEEAWKRALANDADPPNVGDMINAMRESSPQEAVKPSHTKSAEKTILRVPSKQEIIDSLPASLSSSTSSILQEATTAIYQQPACWKIGEQGWASAASAQLVESVAAAVLSLHTLGSIPEAMVDTEGLPPTPKRELQHLPHKDINFETLLGSGTYSEVYRGSWRGSEVAIKLLRPPADVQTDKGAVRNAFLDESRLLSQLMHPNVVTLYGAIDDGRSMAVITEYMPSGSLRSALLDPERRRLGLAGRLKLALDVAHGMEYLHSQRPPVIHFDLKCDNLLCNLKDPDRPICKVGDLGLSREKSGQYVSGRMRGTLPWMAPELFPSSVSTRADQVTEKVDVFSFGVVMWEMWTGREPHAGVAFSDFLQ
eukprot:gene17726-21117_t